MGWARPPQSGPRFGLLSHLPSPRHGLQRVVVTLLPDLEAYLAPAGEDELLLAFLGPLRLLRRETESGRGAYIRHLAEAHPELQGLAPGRVLGTGPFLGRPSQIALGRVFLVGDAAGFVDPLTGDGISCGLEAARELARLLARSGEPDSAYRRWGQVQWRRRLTVGRLALRLSSSPFFGRRAIRGLAKQPGALDRLLEVNQGLRPLHLLPPRDWASLAGF